MTKSMLFLSWFIACIATFMSMYFSERLFLEPCELCWYQRICMFPLVIILGRGAWKRDCTSISYAIPFVLAGFGLALYHMLMQEVFHFDPIGLCDFVHECSHPQFVHFFGMSLPIPVLSVVTFFILAVLLFIARNTDHAEHI